MVSSGAKEEEFDPQVALEVINAQNAPSRARNDGLRFSYLQATMRTDFGREMALVLRPSRGELSPIQAPSRRRPGSFFYNPTSPPSVCVGMTS